MTPQDGKQDFKIVLTRDFFDDVGKPKFRDMGLELFAPHPRIKVTPFTQHFPEISTEQIGDAHAVIALTPQVTAATLAGRTDLLAVGRFGVGYDSVDVPACTRADVLLLIAAGAVDRPVAEATIAWMLALTHHVRIKDRLVRTGEWHERTKFMGSELRDHTLGIIGLGGIGRTLVKLLEGFGMRQPLAFDPFLKPEAAQAIGVELVEMNELLARSDFVSVHCPLNEKTRNLLDAPQIALMKPTAYLLNTARGGIVNEDALYAALKNGRLAGAALDCFDGEPILRPHRFGELDNVILAPHSIAWTDELFRDIGRTACQSMIDLAMGKRPHGVVNAEVFESKGFQEKWARLRLK